MIDPSLPSPAQVHHFRTFGFARLAGCLDAKLFRRLRADFEGVMGPGGRRLPFNELGSPPAWCASCMDEDTPNIVALATDERVLGFTSALLGVPAICVQAAAYRRSEDTRWHSDNPALGYVALKLYINLDPVDAMCGALRIVPGSHRAPLRQALMPPPHQLVEELFGVAQDALPAVALSSQPGDVSVFDLRAWHTVCGSSADRRVIELSYYGDPTDSPSHDGFVAQMRCNQRGAQLAGSVYFTRFWRSIPGPRHARGLGRLRELGLLDGGALT